MNKGQMIKNGLLISTALVAGMLVGCGGGDDKAAAPVQGAKSSSTSQPEKSSESIIDKKLSVYIKCYNSGRDIDRSIERYQSWIKDMDLGPTGKERSVWGLYSLNVNRLNECKKNIDEVAALAPVTELDKVAVTFADNAVAVGKAVEPLYSYYDQKDYKDDDFKKGKELHAPLAKAMKEYIVIADKFSDLIEVENDKRQVEHLAVIEKTQGKNASYYRLSIVIQAKALANLLYKDNFDIDTAKQMIDQYTDTVAAASAYYKDPNNKELMKKQGFMTESNLSRVISKAEDFNKSIKARYRSVRDNKPIRAVNSAVEAYETGTLRNIQAKYNDLVNTYNH